MERVLVTVSRVPWVGMWPSVFPNGVVDFIAILRILSTRRRVQFAAETKCAHCLTASDDENLSGAISWFTFLIHSSEQ
jgi:hypothetical protein